MYNVTYSRAQWIKSNREKNNTPSEFDNSRQHMYDTFKETHTQIAAAAATRMRYERPVFIAAPQQIVYTTTRIASSDDGIQYWFSAVSSHILSFTANALSSNKLVVIDVNKRNSYIMLWLARLWQKIQPQTFSLIITTLKYRCWNNKCSNIQKHTHARTQAERERER